MVIINAIDFVIDVDRERNTVKALVADATSEAPWVIGFAHRLQYLRMEDSREQLQLQCVRH